MVWMHIINILPRWIYMWNIGICGQNKYIISYPWIVCCCFCSISVDQLSGRHSWLLTKLHSHAGSMWKDVTCKCFADTRSWWWFCFSKFPLYWCKSPGSTSKWGVSCSEDVWFSSGINTLFFPWLETWLSKGSNSFLQFRLWCKRLDFTKCTCKIKIYITIWTLRNNFTYLSKCGWKYNIKTLIFSLIIYNLLIVTSVVT